eukprot:TRINITY_DN12864_c0_g1_i1.p1 TRINITY_DN12864_c0_g1~~TRINITY_DN12864_c0_g1_i1.p1  ORF type:complete len:2030 (-),score=386.64 TRINITY_DN12864_c0_g1_i1:131-6163(-)
MAAHGPVDALVGSGWRPESPTTAAWGHQRQASGVSRLCPLYSGASAPAAAQLHSVVEALLLVQFNALENREAVDLNSVKGVRKALLREPSLAWAVPQAEDCLRLLRQRSGAGAPARPIGKAAQEDIRDSSKRSNSAMAQICGAASPPMAGGGCDFAAAMCAKKESNPALSWAAATKLAGVDLSREAALGLVARLGALSARNRTVNAWIVVETCRDCENHRTTLRHEEKAFITRFCQLKSAIERSFPREVAVELLVPQGENGSRDRHMPIPPVRIGAFEVYLCCPEPYVPFGAVALPALPAADDAAPSAFSVICLSSKLQTLQWPVAEVVLRRMITAMPRVPLVVGVETSLHLPIFGVDLEAVTTPSFIQPAEPGRQSDDGEPEGFGGNVCGFVRVSGRTDENGRCTLLVPVNVELRLCAAHESLMEPQDCGLAVPGQSAKVTFVAETVVQFWQAEEPKQLVIYASSPRVNIMPEEAQRCTPFQGVLRHATKGEFRPEANGCIRGAGDLVEDLDLIGCEGWKPGRIDPVINRVHDREGLLEVARLDCPAVTVTLVAACCGSEVPGAKMAVDDEDIGTTGPERDLHCSVRCGSHRLRAEHKLAIHGLQSSIMVNSVATSRVQVKMSPKRLHFVCVSFPRANLGRTALTPYSGLDADPPSVCNSPAATVGHFSMLGGGSSPSHSRLGESMQSGGDLAAGDSMQSATDLGASFCGASNLAADLWLVGGLLDEWYDSPTGPRKECEVWPWEGELRGGGVSAMTVKKGVIMEFESNSEGDCCLTKGITTLQSKNRDWQLVLRPAALAAKCALVELATMSKDGPPSIWIGRMAEIPDFEQVREGNATRKRRRNLQIRSCCCGRGLDGSQIFLDGQKAPIPVDSTGFYGLPVTCEEGVLQFKVEGVPSCLLPGATNEFAAPFSAFSTVCTEVDVSCPLYIYWEPPEETGEEYVFDDDENDSQIELVWVAVDASHVPEEAKAVKGVMECPGNEQESIVLDGETRGPFSMRAAGGLSNLDPRTMPPCLLSRLLFNIEPPAGFGFKAKDPSPLKERCFEIGGCELPRLAQCPVAVGSLEELQPSPPLRVSLRTPCCGRANLAANLDVDGQAAIPSEDHYKLPRKRFDESSGQLQMRFEGALAPCFLPYGGDEFAVEFNPSQPSCLNLDLVCTIWVYWMPPNEDEEEPVGLVYLAVDGRQVPEEARPVVGSLKCEGMRGGELPLDGSSMGPFAFHAEQAFATEAPRCLLGNIEFVLEAPKNYDFIAKYPSPLVERLDELGGCEFERLIDCPIAVGQFSAHPPPKLSVSLRTTCCNRPYDGAKVAFGDEEEGQLLDEEGLRLLYRQRAGGAVKLQFSGVPNCQMPRNNDSILAPYGRVEPAQLDFKVGCDTWIYWVPPPEDEDEIDVPVEELPKGQLFVAVDSEMIPEEALPIKGMMKCNGSEERKWKFDGTSMGPFTLKPVEPSSSEDEKPKEEVPAGEEEEEEEEPLSCLLGNLRVKMEAAPGFKFSTRRPNAIEERCRALGGCEMHRVAQCPVAIGWLKQLAPAKPNKALMRTTCCGRGFAGAQLCIDDADPIPFDQATPLRLPRRIRGDRSGTMQFRFQGVPTVMLPEGSTTRSVVYNPQEADCVKVDLGIPIYVYWLPPEDDEEEEEAEGDEPVEPMGGIFFITCNHDDVPDEGLPVKGTIDCRETQEESITLDGTNVGPFFLHPTQAFMLREIESGVDDTVCILSNLDFTRIQPPTGFKYKARDPSPLADRVMELGGCELQRLTSCPAAVGDMKPLPVPPLHLSLRTACCRRGYAGACVSVNGRKSVPLDEDNDARMIVQRKRKGGTLQVQVSGVPSHLLHGGTTTLSADYGSELPPSIDFDIACPLWIYWVPPDEEDYDLEDPEALFPDGMLFLAVDPEQIAEEAIPVKGRIECPEASVRKTILDGSTMGPFYLSADTGQKQPCILAELEVFLEPFPGFAYRPKDPSPMAERCEELGGCEMQRLTSSPVALGFMGGPLENLRTIIEMHKKPPATDG